MEKIESMSAFLRQNAKQITEVEYAASKRFLDKDGDPVLWRLRPLTNLEIEKIMDRNTKNIQVKGTREVRKEYDQAAAQTEMTLASVVYPNLNDEELQQSYEVVGAEELLKTMLTPGELADLHLAVSEASDFDAGMANKIKQVKN